VTREKRSVAFWVVSVFLLLAVAVLLLGQTSALFAYDFAVALGLQESVDRVGPFGVEVNRAFGASDTFVYIPLMVVALIGLVRRRRWALPMAAAVMGISVYWAVTIAAMMLFLGGVPGYDLVPGLEYWVFLGIFIAIGTWGVFYIAVRGDRLLGAA
jgi:hypothetical protein